jgi:hypothetical protein
VFRSDDQQMLTLIGRLPADRGALASGLRRLVARFDWDAIEALLGPQQLH